MNQTVTEAGHYFEKFKVKAREDVDLVFILPFTDIPVAKMCTGSRYNSDSLRR